MATLNALRSRISTIFDAAAKPAAAAVSRAADSVVTVNCTMNNIHVAVSNIEGQVVSRCSGGMLGYKHRQRASGIAAREIGQQAAKKAFDAGFRMSHVELKGPSKGRAQVLRGIQLGGLNVNDIRDVTPIPTNGCRPKHMRRL
jgi:small subunit ribosomal protein S11